MKENQSTVETRKKSDSSKRKKKTVAASDEQELKVSGFLRNPFNSHVSILVRETTSPSGKIIGFKKPGTKAILVSVSGDKALVKFSNSKVGYVSLNCFVKMEE